MLRHFRGRVLLADEVGLGKTIEACLLLREYLLRGLVKRVLILVPTPLVSQWHEELRSKFGLEFAIPPRTREADRADYWTGTDRVLASLAFAKSRRRAEAVAAAPWDLVIVDEAHHCKNRATRNWQLVNALKRRHLFLLTATPVQNNLLELYNLLTLLEPGHLKTESDFKRQYVRRGNPRDPRNRQRLRSLLGEVMIRNTRSLVQMDLPPRYAQTLMAQPHGDEQRLYRLLDEYLRRRKALPQASDDGDSGEGEAARSSGRRSPTNAARRPPCPAGTPRPAAQSRRRLGRKQLSTLLSASGSHPRSLAESLAKMAGGRRRRAVVDLARGIQRSAKDEKLLELLRQSGQEKVLVFANFRRTLEHLQALLDQAGIAYVTFSGTESDREKDEAVEAFRQLVPVMLCSESGGEGRNLQFANTLINYDLPWNPMRIEQRVGRIHRIGQTREVFIFNLCTAGSLEARLLGLLTDKIRMFELVVGEVGSILGNLEGGEEFESLVLDLWLRSHTDKELDQSFDELGRTLLDAQEEYLRGQAAGRGDVRRGLPMSGGIQEELREFATQVLERRGGLVDWPADAAEGAAVLPREVAAALGRRRSDPADQPARRRRLVRQPGHRFPGDRRPAVAGRAADRGLRRRRAVPETRQSGRGAPPRVHLAQCQGAGGRYPSPVRGVPYVVVPRFRDFRGSLGDAVSAHDQRRDGRGGRGARSAGPLGARAAAGARSEAPSTYPRAVARAVLRARAAADEFFRRMDGRIERDRRRLREYYGALLREAEHKKPRAGATTRSGEDRRPETGRRPGTPPQAGRTRRALRHGRDAGTAGADPHGNPGHGGGLCRCIASVR